MTAIDLVMWWLSPILAIVYVIGYSLIFEPIRKFKKWPAIITAMLDCPMCIGFWAGVFVGLVNWLPIAWPGWLQHAALGGCLAIAAEYILELIWRQ
jgi:hypothetical protein